MDFLIPHIQKENKKSIYSNTLFHYHLELKKAHWQNQKVILKRYSKKKHSDWEPQRFNKEIQITQKCSKFSEQGQPFLKCFGVFLYSSTLTIILEPFDTDLSVKIEKLRKDSKQFSEIELKKIVLRLMDGFCFLESIKVKHRDINPKNILIKGSGENIDVRIIDFGCSEIKQDGYPNTQNDKILISSMYRSPELIGKTQAEYNSFKADVYSLGLVFLLLSDVRIDIFGKNRKEYQTQLSEDIKQVKYNWLRNLIFKMLIRVEERLEFIGTKQFLCLSEN